MHFTAVMKKLQYYFLIQTFILCDKTEITTQHQINAGVGLITTGMTACVINPGSLTGMKRKTIMKMIMMSMKTISIPQVAGIREMNIAEVMEVEEAVMVHTMTGTVRAAMETTGTVQEMEMAAAMAVQDQSVTAEAAMITLIR